MCSKNVVSLLHCLLHFCFGLWFESCIVSSQVLTTGYCDFLRYIEDRSFRRFVEACLEETIIIYVDHLLTQVKTIVYEDNNTVVNLNITSSCMFGMVKFLNVFV